MPPTTLDVLLVEPWWGGSHGAWAEGYRAHSTHTVRIIGHPPGPWRWRVQGSAVTLADAVDEACAASRPDVLLVSSMTDLAQLCGLARRSIGSTPVVHYRHESQLLYPEAPGARVPRGIELQEWASLNAADVVVFNSEFHRRGLFGRLEALLADAPDETHTHRLPALEARSIVLPVGVDLSEIRPAAGRLNGPVRILWNHRWHFDKAPEVFLDAVVEVVDAGADVAIVMCGADDLPDHRPIESRLRRLGDRVVHAGELSRSAYLRAVEGADVAVSTALQECFGVAVVEAMAAGAVPLLPDRLSYPDLVGERFGSAVLYGDGELVDRLQAVCEDLPAARRAVDGLAEEIRRYDWSGVAPRYDELLLEVVGGRRRWIPSAL
ncbi:MAG: DUF3524 domain-containing protein [Actinomycetota bacterium]